MAFWIPAAITAGTSLLGHALRQRQGGPPTPGQISAQPIQEQMDNIGQSGTAQFDQMLSAGSAQAGFQGMANDRMGNAMGMPGAFAARNQAMGSEARGQAFSGFVQGRQGRQQMLNQLAGQMVNIDQANVQNQYQGAMRQWQHGQNQINQLMTGLGGAAVQGASDFHANQQFQAQQTQQGQMNSMLQQYLNQQQQGWQGPNMALAGITG